jgi:hypothetical protein
MSGGTAADYSSLRGPWETLIESLRMQEPPRGLPPFGFLLALLVGLTLPRGDLIQGTPFGLDPHSGSSARAWRPRRAQSPPSPLPGSGGITLGQTPLRQLEEQAGAEAARFKNTTVVFKQPAAATLV